MHAGMVEDHKGLAATAERKIAEGQAEMAKVAAGRDAAKERRERLERGEDVPGGLGKPLTREDAERILRDAGWSKSDIRQCVEMAGLPESAFKAMVQDAIEAQEKAAKAATRAALRRHKVAILPDKSSKM
jgi:hypothetical protein